MKSVCYTLKIDLLRTVSEISFCLYLYQLSFWPNWFYNNMYLVLKYHKIHWIPFNIHLYIYIFAPTFFFLFLLQYHCLKYGWYVWVTAYLTDCDLKLRNTMTLRSLIPVHCPHNLPTPKNWWLNSKWKCLPLFFSIWLDVTICRNFFCS